MTAINRFHTNGYPHKLVQTFGLQFIWKVLLQLKRTVMHYYPLNLKFRIRKGSLGVLKKIDRRSKNATLFSKPSDWACSFHIHISKKNCLK